MGMHGHRSKDVKTSEEDVGQEFSQGTLTQICRKLKSFIMFISQKKRLYRLLLDYRLPYCKKAMLEGPGLKGEVFSGRQVSDRPEVPEVVDFFTCRFKTQSPQHPAVAGSHG